MSVAITVYVVFFKTAVPVLNDVLLHVLPITVWLSTGNALFKNVKIAYPLKITFFVYAMHNILIGIMNTVIGKIVGLNSLNPIVAFFAHYLMVAILYLVVLAFAYITGKILPKKAYFALSGGRVDKK